MPRKPSPPRLWKRSERRDKAGRLTHACTWVILDGGRQFNTGLYIDDCATAQRALADYINAKHAAAITNGPRNADQIPLADVMTLYVRDVVPKHANPEASRRRFRRLAQFFRGKHLGEINGQLCRDYAALRDGQVSARKDLEDLRAAINHHHTEGLHTSVIKIVLPEKPAPRERWLTRSEVARMLWHCWRFKDGLGQHEKRHIARFILVGIYSGSRSGVILQAALQPEVGRPYFDLERALFYRRPEGARETRKRRPTVPIPPRLLTHLRRWKRQGSRFAVEWNGHTVNRMDEGFRHLCAAINLDPPATPHVLRHTCATWLMQAGKDPWKVGGFLGMTLATLTHVYGHHHPDHLDGVLDAFQRRSTANGSQRMT
jgi:integrase